MKSLCDECRYNIYNEDEDEYYCDLQLDEDEYAKMLMNTNKSKPCKYFSPDINEYDIVRKQN